MNERLANLTVTVVGSSDRQLMQLLRQSGMRVVAVSASELDALARASRPPDVVVVDVREQRTLPDALTGFKRAHPQAGVVLVASALDPALMLEAMRAGVNECVAEPLSAAELEQAVGRVASKQTASVGGQVVAVVGAKGGVGTTTVGVNMASALSRDGHSTLFIDLHVAYGDAAVFFGVEPRFSVIDALDNTHRLDEAFFRSLVVSTKAGPDLLASSDRGTVWTPDVARVRQLLEFAAQHYRFVVVDCPRSDAAILDALDACSHIVLVCNQELATVRSTSRMAATLRQRYGGDRVLVVVSRYDPEAEIGQDDVERVVGGRVRHVFPSDYRQSLEALNRGRPVVLRSQSRLAHSFDAFVRELTGARGAEEPGKTGSGFFSRLKGKK